MKKIFLVLFVLTVLTLAALKGSLWYLTEQFIEHQIAQAKPFETSLAGSATVHKLKVYIPLVDESIHIDSIRFTAPDLISLLTMDSQIQDGQLPEALNLIVKGINISLNGKIMQLLDNPDMEPSQVEVFSTLACGDIYRIGSKALSKMGYDELVSDLVLSYQYQPNLKKLSYIIQYHIHDMTNFNISGDLSGISSLNDFKKGTVQPGKLIVEIIDNSYIERKNCFCANEEKLEVADYINLNSG